MNCINKTIIALLTILVFSSSTYAQAGSQLKNTTLKHTMTAFVKESQEFNEMKHSIIQESMRELQEQVDRLLASMDNIPFPIPIPLTLPMNQYQIHSFHQDDLTVVVADFEDVNLTIQIELVSKINDVSLYRVDSMININNGY